VAPIRPCAAICPYPYEFSASRKKNRHSRNRGVDKRMTAHLYTAPRHGGDALSADHRGGALLLIWTGANLLGPAKMAVLIGPEVETSPVRGLGRAGYLTVE